MQGDIGRRIAELRKERGINQEELAEMSMLHRVTIAKYESGQVEPGATASYPECHRFKSYLSHITKPLATKGKGLFLCFGW